MLGKILLLKNILNNSTVFEELLFVSLKCSANEQDGRFVIYQQNLVLFHQLSQTLAI
jgi:hypothetical protein